MFDERDLIVGPLAGEQFALPQREGPADLGKAQEFAMSAVGLGDFGNIRTVEFVQPDGTIARLRTRGGYPVFETDEQTTTSTSIARGFVAKVPSGRAVLFSPYTLAVLNSKYTPAGKHYTVQDFATTWGVPAGDTTHWHDVVLADGSVKINAKTYSPFGSFGTLSETSIPHVINRADDYDQYGNTELNLTQKRYFEVERESVKTWGGAGSVSLLTPQAPITDSVRRAMTIGPVVDFAGDTALLAEFYSSSVIWDDPGASWLYSMAAVQMLLTSAYLVKTSSTANVDMPVPGLSGPTASSGNMRRGIGLPPTEIGLVGTGMVGLSIPYVSSPGTTNGQYTVFWPWTGTISRSLPGEVYSNYSRTSYSGSASSSETQAGLLLEYSSTNEKNYDLRDDWTYVLTGSVHVADHATTLQGADMGATADALFWGQADPDPLEYEGIPGTRGVTDIPINGLYVSGSSLSRNYEEQVIECSVQSTLGTLVRVDASRFRSSGPYNADYIPNTDYYDAYLADPWGDVSAVSGMGYYSSCQLRHYAGAAGDFVAIRERYKVVGGTQAPSAAADINAKYTALRDSLLGQALYDSEQTDGTTRNELTAYYTGVVRTTASLDDQLLTWTTVDHLLCDEVNGVFVTVEGSFSGSQSSIGDGEATLTVTLKVTTRHSTNVHTLEVFTIPYWELLIERDIGSGNRAVPSPQIRAIFAPLYREQGSFKGAHYVTQAEELAGATPFHGFNFRLRLTGYDAVGSVNTLNNGETVYLVPCNLLEMLYAFVFSQEYGVAEDGARYPVTNIWNYNLIMNSLFTNGYRVAVRDGVVGNWTDTFGTDFAETSTISLHRT